MRHYDTLLSYNWYKYLGRKKSYKNLNVSKTRKAAMEKIVNNPNQMEEYKSDDKIDKNSKKDISWPKKLTFREILMNYQLERL